MKNVRTSGMKSPWSGIASNQLWFHEMFYSFFLTCLSCILILRWDLVRWVRFSRLVSMLGNHIIILGGGNSNILYLHPKNWGRFPVWLMFFNRAETTNQYRIGKGYYHLFEIMPTKKNDALDQVGVSFSDRSKWRSQKRPPFLMAENI